MKFETLKNYAAAISLSSALLISNITHADDKYPEIMTTIKPLHSIVENLIEGTDLNADVIVDGNASPHGFHLKPAQIEKLNHAKIVVLIDEDFEGFLHKALDNLGSTVIKAEMLEGANIKLLKLRKDANWEAHVHHEEAHGHDEDEHGHKNAIYDHHIWLSINNASLIADYLANLFTKEYPAAKDKIAANLQNFKTRLKVLDKDTKADLESVKEKPFIVFHDAFQYFEKDNGISGVGSITFDPDQMPDPKRIKDVKDKISKLDTVCVFSEPQFDSKLIDSVTEGTDAKIGVLDENGAKIKKGKELYFDLIKQITKSFKECLSSTKS